VYKDEVVEAAPEETPKPETFTDEKVVQAEPPKPSQVTMLPVTISVEAEPLFDFDKYSIRADSRKRLDALVQQLKGVSYGEVITVGFADPIGTAKYNQRLSDRRAASVKRYLVSKGIPADKIKTEGRGKTEEYASYKSCSGQGKKKMIACLQPDRRVEVTVTAEKQQ
jgi:OOP family OmpA-OmpF porin